jgi:hypothetical protein
VTLTLVACDRDDHPAVLPANVNGFWTTSDARYQDRFLELAGVYVIIGTGAHDPPTLQVIDKIDTVRSGKVTAYTVYATDLQGISGQMTFEFDPANGGELQFKNQHGIVWKRHSTDNPPAKK